ncbi:MAG TPA: histidine phosphatase family protein [Nocardioides sp.]
MLHLVRHGPPLVDRSVPAAQWDLDPAGYDAVWALRESGRLPERATWFCSPEPKAIATAQLLTDRDVGVLDDLREHVRESPAWIEDFAGTVRRAFAQPDLAAADGWETITACRARVLPAVETILDVHRDEDVVLVGHGTAWTLVVAALTGRPPDLDAWAALRMPDLIVPRLETTHGGGDDT